MPDTEATTITGRLEPAFSCQELAIRFHTRIYQSGIVIRGSEVELTVRPGLGHDFHKPIQLACLALSASLDGQLLVSGQPVQAIIEHPALRRGEGEAIHTSRLVGWRKLTNEQMLTGLRVGNIAEHVVPLAHALRDYRLGLLLPPEDGATFLWRSLESVLWFLADEKRGKPNLDIETAAQKLNVPSSNFELVKEKANHQEKFARHASRKYRERLQFLERAFGKPAPPFFSQQVAGNDDGMVDVFPVSFSDQDWHEMSKATWSVLIAFVHYLGPHVVGFLIVPPW